MDAARPDVVLDCNVFVQAITRSQGPAARVLRLVEKNRVTLHLSKPILRELRRTLAYPELRGRNPSLTDEVAEAFVGRVMFRGVLARAVPHVFTYERDPNDEPYIDLAAAVGATFLVTRDNDLLCLMSDHTLEAKEFRQRFASLRILDPVAFLTEVDAAHDP
jgi:putative PIN family toxin of toxin-antitoxin system